MVCWLQSVSYSSHVLQPRLYLFGLMQSFEMVMGTTCRVFSLFLHFISKKENILGGLEFYQHWLHKELDQWYVKTR